VIHHDAALLAMLAVAGFSFLAGFASAGVCAWLWFLRVICGLTWRDVVADAWAAVRRP